MYSSDQTECPHDEGAKLVPIKINRTQSEEVVLQRFKQSRVVCLLAKKNTHNEFCLFLSPSCLLIPADGSLLPRPLLKPTYEKMPLSINHANPAFTPFLLAEGLSSMETLLTNIQVTE